MSTNIKKCFVNSNEAKAIYVNDDIVYAKEYIITVNISNGSYSGNNKINYKGNGTITLTADTGYNLPSTISVTNALYTYNDETGIIYLQEPSGNVVISATCSIISYPINVSVIDGSYSGDASIDYGSTASVTISANSGYDLPSSITVSGASYTYNSSTGVISLSAPSGNVTISATCPVIVSGYTVSVASFGSSPYGLAHGYYSLDDGVTWIEITSAGVLSSSATQIKFKVEGQIAMEDCEIKSATLGLDLTHEYDPVVSQNYILTNNVTDIIVEFHDND